MAKGVEREGGKELIGAMESVVQQATVAIPLANKEFPLIEAKFKGYPNTIVSRIQTPLKLAQGLVDTKNLKDFIDRVKQGDEPWVTAIVLETVDQLRGVDAALLAEWLAGSNKEQVIVSYEMEEAALFRLVTTYQDWRGKISQ
jgi:hypothetical protein